MAKRYEELEFTDDFMFCRVLTDNPDIARVVKIDFLKGDDKIEQ